MLDDIGKVLFYYGATIAGGFILFLLLLLFS